MISVLLTRPEDWVTGGYGSSLDLHYVSIGGKDPKKNSGKTAGDGIGVKATEEGINELISKMKEIKPAIFVYAQHQRFEEKHMKMLRRASPDTIWCLMQNNEPHTVSRYVRKFKKYINVVLIGNYHMPSIVGHYELGKGVVPGFWDGFVPEHHQYKSFEHAKYDCFFGGYSHRDNGKWKFPNSEGRHRFICSVQKNHSLLLCGKADQWPFETHGMRSHFSYLEAMQDAKIALGYNHYDLERYYTRRTIHSGASGRLFITRYIPGMREDFPFDDEAILSFHNDTIGMLKINGYLNDENKMKRRAEKQKQFFLKHHTWEARLRRFEELAFEIIRRGKDRCVY